MSRIDELQRLHEAAEAQTSSAWRCMEASWQTYRSWPAIHRVLLAARKWTKAIEMSGATNDLTEALRALDGDKGAT